ncbi:GPN-loop GTPase 3 like protein [Phakopsora pachyrhizi]|uniref:GPN-loop GTPase 3 n=1 Tax=Phakopsora pachyrhizi TaxID=170000 RepID=A0AAV0ADS7_PHAPC|nr:GPN-loop GTPase 3 like protein [Phakopsora pachyrhizi]CAH7666204.1 GPN-loop GTPase 3 like protein [Phakopsora pachyrhizi]
MRYAVLVCGPAGSGKSTFSSSLITHAQTLGRVMHLFNLDPAAEEFGYEPSIDIRDLISLDDVMEELDFGPNGGLVYCFEYLLKNLDWLQENLNNYEDDYLVIDCPGQIELYTHFNIIQQIVQVLTVEFNFRLCATYLLESNFISDGPKFFSGVLSATSAMINLEIPHLNLLSKMDLIKPGQAGGGAIANVGSRELERYLDPDPDLLLGEVNSKTNPRFHSLNQAISHLIQDFNMVSFLPLDVTDENSVGLILSHIDNSLQYGESEEPKEPKDMDEGDFNVSNE